MFFFVRHGERADHSKDPSERNKIEVKYDPHLTSIGYQQALLTGQFLKQQLEQHYNTIDINNLNIVLLASPFL